MSTILHSRVGRIALGSAGVVLVTLTAGACADILNGNRTREASLSFGVKQPGALVNASSDGSDLIVITGGGHTLDLQTASVVFSEMTFEGQNVESGDDDDSDVDSDSDHEGNAKFRAGATTLSLPLAGGMITPFTGQVPVGTYSRLEMDADFLQLKGTYDGQAFDVTVPVNAEMELRFAPPLAVTASSAPINVSINIDVSSWFKDASGNTIDPRQLATNATLRAEFRNRVRASFKAFEDSDHDGDESDSDSDG